MSHGHRPNWLARMLNRVDATLGSLGVGTNYGLVTLEVTGRTSRRTVSLPVAIVVVAGQRYLVSMLGENVHWVKIVRAAGGRAVIRSGGRQAVHLEEVRADQRGPILKAYLQRALGARSHVPVNKDAPLTAFEQIAGTYPTFRFASDTAVQTTSRSSPVQRRSRLEMALFALSAADVPIGIVALRRLGRLGGLLLEVATSALDVRAVAMVATGALSRLRLVPRLLLYAEAAVDGLAALAGFWAWVWQPDIRPTPGERAGAGMGRRRWVWIVPPAKETCNAWVTPLAVCAWMVAVVLHTTRMAIYISPGRALRKGAAADS
jgi:hypothetical protein